jgi:hypothetical protein
VTDGFGDDYDRERIRLAEADLALTNDFIKGVVATGAALRGSAITIWLALVGFAVQQHLAMLGMLAAMVAFGFWLIDGYHGWLYSEASAHARALERLLSRYYDMISRVRDDPDVLGRFRVDLRAHRCGLYLSFRAGFGPRQMWNARPVLIYRVLYVALVAIALLIMVLVVTGALGSSGSPGPTHIIIDQVPRT